MRDTCWDVACVVLLLGMLIGYVVKSLLNRWKNRHFWRWLQEQQKPKQKN